MAAHSPLPRKLIKLESRRMSPNSFWQRCISYDYHPFPMPDHWKSAVARENDRWSSWFAVCPVNFSEFVSSYAPISFPTGDGRG
jgi:hypothetical protein